MQSLWLLTKKNLKLLLRAKASALIVIFAPLLIILILGLSYNTSTQYGLNIGVYASSFTEDVNSFINLLEEEEFQITKYESSIDQCIADIKSGIMHTCISLPESLQIEENTAKEVTFYVDPSRINLVWMIQETVKTKFNFKAQEISESLTENILTILADTKNKINEKRDDIDTVKDQNIAASSSTEAVTQNLVGVDVSIPTASYDLAVLTNVTNRIDLVEDKISSALDTIENSSISGEERSNIQSQLNSAKKELSQVSSLVGGTGTESIKGIIENLEVDLNIVKEKLTNVAGTIDATSTSLSTVNSQLQTSITSINKVLATLNEVSTNIESQKITDASTITAPLTTKIEKVSEEGTYLNYLFPAILILVVMFSSLLLGTTLVMMEKNSPAFLRNFFLPVRKSAFVISTYLTSLVLIVVQIIIILGISIFFMKNSIFLLPTVALILFIAASVFTFLGMVIGYLFVSEETGVLASISLGSLFLFISGVILPLEGISPVLREIAAFNPFVIAEKLVREVFIFGSSLTMVWVDLLILVCYAIILFLVILLIESILHRNVVHRFMKHHHRLHRHKDKVKKNNA